MAGRVAEVPRIAATKILAQQLLGASWVLALLFSRTVDLWKQAKREATQAFSREREAAAAMATDDKQDREHLLGMVETLQAGNAALAAQAQAARTRSRASRPGSPRSRTNSTVSAPRSSGTASCRR